MRAPTRTRASLLARARAHECQRRAPRRRRLHCPATPQGRSTAPTATRHTSAPRTSPSWPAPACVSRPRNEYRGGAPAAAGCCRARARSLCVFALARCPRKRPAPLLSSPCAPARRALLGLCAAIDPFKTNGGSRGPRLRLTLPVALSCDPLSRWMFACQPHALAHTHTHTHKLKHTHARTRTRTHNTHAQASNDQHPSPKPQATSTAVSRRRSRRPSRVP
jgi:hypothetical protein